MNEPYTVNIPEIGELTHNKDLFYYDGPLLSIYNDKIGNTYLGVWADILKDCYLYYYCMVSDTLLENYLMGNITLLDCIKESGTYYFQSDSIENEINYKIVGFDNMDEKDLPTNESYFK
jgi:hypothetical protein